MARFRIYLTKEEIRTFKVSSNKMIAVENIVVGNIIKHYGWSYRVDDVQVEDDNVRLKLKLVGSLDAKQKEIVMKKGSEVKVYETKALNEPCGISTEKIKREWSKVDECTLPFTGTRYTTWQSPSGTYAVIHEADQELVAVIDNGKITYMHPGTIEGLKRAGVFK